MRTTRKAGAWYAMFLTAVSLAVASIPEGLRIPDEKLRKRVDVYRVFARVSPKHKVKIVRAHKSRGNVVCMTGDGVNDAPSLNAADIGMATGTVCTDVAKNAADMVLADDDFGTIISAIEQGRNIYNNIRKAVLFLLTSNLGEVIAMFVAIVLGWPIPCPLRLELIPPRSRPLASFVREMRIANCTLQSRLGLSAIAS